MINKNERNKKISARQSSIIKMAKQNGFVEVEVLSSIFALTPQTVRKDVNDLCARNLLRRFHGGASLPEYNENLPYKERQKWMPDTKFRIGQMVADRIEDGASLFINIGTTTEAVANSLLVRKNLRVVTNNLNVANILAGNATFDIEVAGGSLRKRDRGIVGHVTTSFMAQYRMDYGIIGVSGIDQDGSLLDFDSQETETARTIMRNSEKVLLVADHTKFGRNAVVRYGSLDDVDELFTDSIPSTDFDVAIATAKIRVHLPKIKTSLLESAVQGRS